MKVYAVTGWQGNQGLEDLIQAFSRDQAIDVFKSLYPYEKFNSFSVELY